MFYREVDSDARQGVNNSMNSNMFEVTGESVLTLFAGHLSGAPTSSLLTVSSHSLEGDALQAMEKSAASLGFGSAPLALLTLEAAEGTLGAEDVRTCIEGIDPVALVATDARAAELLSSAYRTPVTLDALNRLLGRSVIVFQDFGALLKTSQSKQRAWALLKKLR